MKIALVNDWLNTKYGGAEQVFLSLVKLYPEADIYTLVYNQKNYADRLGNRKVHTSFLQKFPNFFKQRQKLFLPLIARAVESFDFSDYDLVISSSGAFVKNINPRNAKHISYCHSPMRFAWDYYDNYFQEQAALNPVLEPLAKWFVRRLRRWDLAGTETVDAFITNSQTSAHRIKKYYNRQAQLVHPPVKIKQFQPAKEKQDYYLTLGRLSPYKKINLAIKACTQSKRKLIVAGDGDDRTRLESIAGRNVSFEGYVDENRKIKLLAQAKALIFPNKEDFGIVPIEAMASGTPVVAYRAGGATETLVGDKTGVFFEEQTLEALNQALDKFETKTFDSQTLRQQAEKFSENRFQREIKEFIDNFWSQNAPNQ